MKTLTLSQSLDAFQMLFRDTRHEMFKAEVLQDYTAVDDSPSLRAWLRGDKKKAQELGKGDAGIIAYRKQCLKSPASITRVHVVQQPYTPYLEWEIQVCYKASLIAYGAESVLLVAADKIDGIQLPKGDFWIFDNKQVLQWKYQDDVGKTIGACIWDESEGDSLDSFRQTKEALLDAAEPIV